MKQGLRTLSGLDAVFLYLEAAGTPMHVGSLMRLASPRQRGFDLHQRLIEHVAARIERAAPLRRVLQAAPLDLGHPLWLDQPSVDLRRHILRRRLRRPGGEKQLLDLVARLHAEPLPRERPLWQFVVIEGLHDGSLALYAKIHHALLDGQGGVALARVLLDSAPTRERAPSAARSKTASDKPGQRALADAALRAGIRQFSRLLRAVPETARMVAGQVREPAGLLQRLRRGLSLAPRTVLNRQIGAARAMAFLRLDLARLKALAKGHGVSLNDVLLALCAGGLREYLAQRQALPKASLIAAMPVSLRAAGDAGIDNQVSMLPCPLHTDIADPLERLRAIAASTAAFKQQVGALRGLLPTDFPGLAAPIWATGLSRLWGRARLAERLPLLANLVISNVPGPPQPLYVAGARLEAYYPLSIVTHGLGLNITAQSYAGHLDIGFTACRAAVPDPGRLSHAVERALETLERCPSPHRTNV